MEYVHCHTVLRSADWSLNELNMSLMKRCFTAPASLI